jgi:hypothetical protein
MIRRRHRGITSVSRGTGSEWREQGRAAARCCADRTTTTGTAMITFFRRLLMHYGIYRRYPLPPLPALKNAWRIARA